MLSQEAVAVQHANFDKAKQQQVDLARPVRVDLLQLLLLILSGIELPSVIGKSSVY